MCSQDKHSPLFIHLHWQCPSFYKACHFEELSRESILCIFLLWHCQQQVHTSQYNFLCQKQGQGEMIGLWVSLVVGFALGHLVGLCLEANPIGRMSSGSPPPFFSCAKIEERKKRGKRDRRRTDHVAISITLFFQRIFPIARFFNSGNVTP